MEPKGDKVETARKDDMSIAGCLWCCGWLRGVSVFCGLDLDTDFDISSDEPSGVEVLMNESDSPLSRAELKMLQKAVDVRKDQWKMVRADYLPTLYSYKRKASADLSALSVFLRENQFPLSLRIRESLLARAQVMIPLSAGRKDSPRSVRRYSTRGGTSG